MGSGMSKADVDGTLSRETTLIAAPRARASSAPKIRIDGIQSAFAKPRSTVMGNDLPADSDVWTTVQHLEAAAEVTPGGRSGQGRVLPVHAAPVAFRTSRTRRPRTHHSARCRRPAAGNRRVDRLTGEPIIACDDCEARRSTTADDQASMSLSEREEFAVVTDNRNAAVLINNKRTHAHFRDQVRGGAPTTQHRHTPDVRWC